MRAHLLEALEVMQQGQRLGAGVHEGAQHGGRVVLEGCRAQQIDIRVGGSVPGQHGAGEDDDLG